MLPSSQVAARKNKTVAILVDTRGPEIRTCYLVDGPETRQPVDTISLEQGQTVLLTAHDPTGTEPFEGWKTATETRIPVSYPDLAVQVTPGTTVLINDGDIRLEVTEVSGGDRSREHPSRRPVMLCLEHGKYRMPNL